MELQWGGSFRSFIRYTGSRIYGLYKALNKKFQRTAGTLPCTKIGGYQMSDGFIVSKRSEIVTFSSIQKCVMLSEVMR